jgi:dihydroorotase
MDTTPVNKQLFSEIIDSVRTIAKLEANTELLKVISLRVELHSEALRELTDKTDTQSKLEDLILRARISELKTILEHLTD